MSGMWKTWFRLTCCLKASRNWSLRDCFITMFRALTMGVVSLSFKSLYSNAFNLQKMNTITLQTNDSMYTSTCIRYNTNKNWYIVSQELPYKVTIRSNDNAMINFIAILKRNITWFSITIEKFFLKMELCFFLIKKILVDIQKINTGGP